MAIHYSAGLDGLRALAALTVVAYHAKVPGLTGGFFGVDIFFVLSGYLITRLLVSEHEQHGRVDVRRFMLRRLRRLYPAFLLMLAGYLLIAPLFFSQVAFAKHARDAVWSALYIINFSPAFGTTISVLGHAWSLAVEVQFYLVWPLVFILLMRLPGNARLPSMVLLYLLATAWRWWGVAYLEDVWGFYVRTDMHSSGLLLGCLLGYANVKLPRHAGYAGVLILLFSLTFFSSRWVATAHYGFTLAELGAALLIISPPSWLGASALAWLGRISYGLYLWHYPVMAVLRAQQWTWQYTLAVGFSLGLMGAVLSYYLVERRFHKPRFQNSVSAGQTRLA